MQSDVGSQRASTAVAGRQTGAKPTAFAGVATRKGRAYARTFFLRIKQETKWGKKLLFSNLCIKHGLKIRIQEMCRQTMEQLSISQWVRFMHTINKHKMSS